MANKYLDNDGVLYLWGKIKALVSGAVPTKTSDLTNDSGFITSADVPEGATASTSTPFMDSGDGSVGTSTAFARGDHVHPSDTSKLSIKDIAIAKLTTSSLAGMSYLYLGTDENGNALGAYFVDETGAQGFKNLLNGKADAVSGKGLSTNDYTTAEKNKLAEFSSASDYALKSDITNMYKYKGSVATVSALPSSDNTTGDVYNVEASGMNYAWNGTAWDALGEIFTITAITNSELDTICV